jgi:hypothetical protein
MARHQTWLGRQIDHSPSQQLIWGNIVSLNPKKAAGRESASEVKASIDGRVIHHHRV